MNKKYLGMMLLVAVVGILAVAGPIAESSNRMHDAMYVHHIRQVHLTSEPLSTTVSGTPAYFEYSSGGKAPVQRRVWSLLVTSNWVFVNPIFAPKSCKVLGAFTLKTQQGLLPTEEQLATMVTAFHGKSVNIQGYVPRFTQRPEALTRLNECLGYGFDEKRGVLTLDGKPVALMANEQPGLRL